MIRSTTKVLLLAMAGMAGVSAAVAAHADAAPAFVVQYRSQDLATDAGARHVYHQLERAAERVCEQASTGRLPSVAEMSCRREALSGAIEKIHSPRLVAVYTKSSKSG